MHLYNSAFFLFFISISCCANIIGIRRRWNHSRRGISCEIVSSNSGVSSNWDERNPDFLLGRASSPSVLASLALAIVVFSPPRTYGPERVICRPDLENCGSVLDLSTRTHRTSSVGSGCPYVAGGILAGGAAADWRAASYDRSAWISLWISYTGNGARRGTVVQYFISIWFGYTRYVCISNTIHSLEHLVAIKIKNKKYEK